MTIYLVGILYHEPDSWEQYQKGVIEDCESSTGIFVEASSKEEAISWEKLGKN